MLPGTRLFALTLNLWYAQYFEVFISLLYVTVFEPNDSFP